MMVRSMVVRASRTGRRRLTWPAAVFGLAVATVAVTASELVDTDTVALHAQADTPVLHLRPTPGALRVVEPGYILSVDPRTAVATLAAPDGVVYSSMPLTALVGSAAAPVARRVRMQGQAVVAEALGKGGDVLSRAVLTPGPQGLTVSFSCAAGGGAGGASRFFYDGRRGLDMAPVAETFSADPAAVTGTRTPRVDLARRTPFAPSPFDLEVRSAAGWMGIGVVEVPDATAMWLDASGAVQLDYPVSSLATQASGLLTFPSFAVTFGATALDGLRAYHAALVGLGAAPETPVPGPAWWRQPIVDTWGAQVAAGAARKSPAYTAAWVRSFVADVSRRYGLKDFTVVIDSAWQRRVGEAEPDLVRFGGWQGMRRLIDGLHAQGLHVVLWWPMWGHDPRHIPPARRDIIRADAAHVIDPTAPGFEAAMAATVGHLLGSGGGDLNADGLKLDWGYDVPVHFADPSRGWGAAALYRYLATIHSDAHAVRADAFVESSAAAPQFQPVTDAVRLYDAWSSAAWDARAAVVAAVDPGQLIDGDGWQTTAADAVEHAVASSAYGIPALYFDGRWASGSPIPAETTREIGQVMAVAPSKGPGIATLSPGGDWTWTGPTAMAQSFAGQRDLLVWQPGACGGGSGTLVATASGVTVVPVPEAARMTIRAGRTTVPATHTKGGLRVDLRAGTTYSLVAPC